MFCAAAVKTGSIFSCESFLRDQGGDLMRPSFDVIAVEGIKFAGTFLQNSTGVFKVCAHLVVESGSKRDSIGFCFFPCFYRFSQVILW